MEMLPDENMSGIASGWNLFSRTSKKAKLQSKQSGYVTMEEKVEPIIFVETARITKRERRLSPKPL